RPVMRILARKAVTELVALSFAYEVRSRLQKLLYSGRRHPRHVMRRKPLRVTKARASTRNVKDILRSETIPRQGTRSASFQFNLIRFAKRTGGILPDCHHIPQKERRMIASETGSVHSAKPWRLFMFCLAGRPGLRLIDCRRK